MTPKFRVADRIVYRITKTSLHPEPNARLVVPAENGDGYSYCVDNFWVIDSVAVDGTLVARSHQGNLHRLKPDDPNLRRATWLESWFDGSRFPSPGLSAGVATS